AASGKFRLGIANGAGSVSEQLAADLATNATYLVVLRYNPATGVSTLWVNPSSESDPGTNATDVATASAISAFAFREDPGIGTFTVDDLRVGLTFASVAGAPRLRIEPLPNAVRLAWSVGAAGFLVQTNSNLNTTNWQNLGVT